MGKKGYLAMRTDQETSDLIASDWKEFSVAAKKLVNHAIKLGGLGFGAAFLQWVATFAAMNKVASFTLVFVSLHIHLQDAKIQMVKVLAYFYFFQYVVLNSFGTHSHLLILDRTHWKTNILTGLLIPYIFFSLPSVLFHCFRGEVGKWIALIAIILRLFFPRHFPKWMELPAALILLIVVAPSLFADTIRDSWVGVFICLIIWCYLLQEHIRAAGGIREAFTKAQGIWNTIGIIILFIYPVWALVHDLT